MRAGPRRPPRLHGTLSRADVLDVQEDIEYDLAGTALHRLSEETPVIREHRRVAVAEQAAELRRALDIGEDECDRSMREIWGQSLLQWDLGPDAGSRARGPVDRKLAV